MLHQSIEAKNGSREKAVKVRASNIELLRILATFLIVAFHCAFHSGFTYVSFSTNAFVVKVFYLFGELGVNLFLLISGYFQINSQFKIKKVVLFFLELTFYVILSEIIVSVVTNTPLSPLSDIVLSILFPKYWFFTAYILLYILSPFINKLVSSCTTAERIRFLKVCWIIWSVIPTLFAFTSNGRTENQYFFNRFIWSVVMYCTGACISLNSIEFLKNKKTVRKLLIACIILMLFSIFLIGTLKDVFARVGITEPAFFWQINTLPMGLLSICIFACFASWKVGTNKVINYLSSTSLGVYLLTDGALRNTIWRDILNVREQLGRSALYSLCYLLVVPLVVTCLAIVVDLARQIIEKHTIVKFLNSNKKDRIISELGRKL